MSPSVSKWAPVKKTLDTLLLNHWFIAILIATGAMIIWMVLQLGMDLLITL